MANRSRELDSETGSSLSTLTVENVTRLELQYESSDGDLLERRKVEDYIRNAQMYDQQQDSRQSLTSTMHSEEPFKTSQPSILEDTYDNNDKEKEMQASYSETRKKSKVPASASVTKTMENVQKCQTRSVHTQTEWSCHDLSAAGITTENTESEDQPVSGSVSSSSIQIGVQTGSPDLYDTDRGMPASKADDSESVTSETTLKSKSVDSKTMKVTVNVGEHPEIEANEDLECCDFCLMPKKAFPSVEQLISDPPSMLFCCVKSQELFQFMIMDAIKSYTPEDSEEANGKNEITPDEAQETNEVTSEESAKKNKDESPQTPPYNAQEMKALNVLREELQKINKDYMKPLMNHLDLYGSLFVTEKISFTLASAVDSFMNKEPAPDFQATCNIDDYFCPVLNSTLLNMPDVTVSECYRTGSNFLTLFPDGTGQVSYPSGNISILIACSEPAQFTFIILEDAKHKPQIQAIFLNNGHAACYHLNGRLWTVLDPCGGSYFDENGALEKQWAWWDFSRHVHAPPFQPITLKFNSNTEVKILTQDKIYLTFTMGKKKIAFNVGSKLILKEPESLSQIMPWTSDTECYLCSKHHQIFKVLNNIRDLLRISQYTHSTTKTAQDYLEQIQKSLDYITRLASKQSDSAEVKRNKCVPQSVTSVKKKLQAHGTLLQKRDHSVTGKKNGTGRGSDK
ncbi:glutamate-rich protein 6B isoform X2 [Hyperolius riggenbachi]|uniref:glutamate-rich protein 6B isoform X2 n=1 Tax=Hyperolius riggenbachi TaxID=752182 RepID=UPI0035A37069